MNCSLNARSSTNYYPNLAVYTYHAAQPVGLQTICSEISDPARLQGTLSQALSAGVNLGAKFIEVYPGDADASANQRLLASEEALLKQIP